MAVMLHGPSTFLIDTESRLPTCNAQHPLYIVYNMHSFIPFLFLILIQFHILIPQVNFCPPCPEGKLGKLAGGLSRIHNLKPVAKIKSQNLDWGEADCRVVTPYISFRASADKG